MARARALEDGDRLVVSRRIYLTPRGSWVYLERADVNWDRWNAGGDVHSDWDEDDDTSSTPSEGRRIFEVSASLDELAGLAPPELLAAASEQGVPVERLDI